MPLVLELPDQYGFVLAVASSTFFVNYLHMGRTGTFRKASGLLYPISYATEEQAAKDKNAYKFNCAQRAHTNFIENQGSFLGGLLITGLRHPVVASILGAVWVVCRVQYLYGYTGSAGPKGRMLGNIPSILIDFALRSMALYTSVMFALAK